jgi:hypothetical protein
MSTEQAKALRVLIPCLQQLGHVVSARTQKKAEKTYDLSLDGGVAELKAKGKPFANLDFITYTENQFKAIKSGAVFDTYIVCGVSSGTPEIFKVSSKHLNNLKETKWMSYAYNGGELRNLQRKGLIERIL